MRLNSMEQGVEPPNREGFERPAIAQHDFAGVALLCAMTLSMGLAMAFVMPYTSLFALRETGMAIGMYGLMSLLGAIGAIGCTIGCGILADRTGRRIEIAVSCLLAGAIAFVLLCLTKTPLILFLVTVSLQAAFNAAPAQMLALSKVFTDTWTKEHASQGMGLVRAAFSLAWAIGPILGANLLSNGGFTWVFGTSAVLCVLAAYLTTRLASTNVSSEKRESQGGSIFKLLLATKQLRIYFFAVAIFSLCSNINLIALPLLLADVKDGTQTIGHLFGFSAVAECVLMLVLAIPLGHQKAANMLCLGAISYGIYLTGVVWAGSERIAMLFGLQLLNALATTIFMLVGVLAFQEITPNSPGVSTGLFASALTTGTILHGPVFSLVYSQFGAKAPFLTGAILCISMSILLLITGMSAKSKPNLSTTGS